MALSDTKFVPLPYSYRRNIVGGCVCWWCKSHPHKTPQWDTVAYDPEAPKHSWVVHAPEMSQD